MPYWRIAVMLVPLAVILGSTHGSTAERNSYRSVASQARSGAQEVPARPGAEDPAGNPSGSSESDSKLPPVISVDDGVRRFSIEPTREFDGLCAFYEAYVGPPGYGYGESPGINPNNCALKVKTIAPSVIVSGKRDTEVEWAGVLGLADRNVQHVVLQLEDGSKHELPLTPWRDTPWATYSFNFQQRPFPEFVLAYDASKKLLAKAGLSAGIRPDCLVEEVCGHNSERWTGAWINAYPGNWVSHFSQSDARRTYEIVMGDQRLKSILGTGAYWVDDFGPWLTCDWKGRLGTWANVMLPKPHALEADWPYAELTPAGNDYVLREEHRRVPDVSSALVLVDLSHGGVIAVDPYMEETTGLTFSGERIVTTTTDIGAHWVGQTDCNLN
jgi:hypothetical protein